MDNASSNDRAINILRPLVSGYHNSLLHQRCACHIINLIVKADLEEIEDQIHRLWYTISYFKSTNQHIASFRRYCRPNCVPQRTFSLDVPTRWNLMYLMIDSVLPYKQVFTASRIHNELTPYSLMEDDWTVCTIFHSFLNTFFNHTVTLSAVYRSNVALHSLLGFTEAFS